MLFGMTRGELILVAFIFFLVYGAGFLPRVGEWVGRAVFAPAGSKRRDVAPPKDAGD